MRRILSITALTFREAIRSRMAGSVAVALALVVAGLPCAMRGDGTDAGLAGTTVFYTLSLAFTLLAVAALWASSAAISSEAKARTLQLARVKPVRMWQLWLGRWIGLVAIFGLFLALSLVGLWVRVRAVAPFRTASEKIPPVLPSVEEQVENAVREAERRGETEKGALQAIRRQARSQIPFATISLAPGGRWRWTFRSAAAIDPARPLGLLLTFESDPFSAPARASGYLRDTARAGAADDRPATFRIDDLSSREMRVELSARGLGGAHELELGFAHDGAKDASPILLQPRQGLFLLRPACSLEANVARAFLVMLPLLALLVAAGLALGALFSLPVAVFCATGLVVSVFAADYASLDPDVLDFSDEASPSFLRAANERIAVATTRALQAVARTAVHPSPISELAGAEQIPLREIAASVGWNGLAIPALLMVLSSLAMSRKELPE